LATPYISNGSTNESRPQFPADVMSGFVARNYWACRMA
jgi:hypothetical protein